MKTKKEKEIKMLFIPKTDSTNSEAQRWLKREKPEEGSLIHTDYQTSGRGQRGNYWESEDGANLIFSMILYPDFIEAQNQFLISKVVTLAVRDSLNCHIDNVLIKWPNDIYVGKEKIAGILIENQISGPFLSTSIIGVGINLNQKKFESDAPNPISLSLLTHQTIDRDEFLQTVASLIWNYYEELAINGPDHINQEYLNSLLGLDEQREFLTNGKAFKGYIRGVNELGQLLVETKEGQIKTFSFKEIVFKQ